MKAENQVIAAAGLVFSGVILGKYIDSGVVVGISEVVLPAVSTLVAAFWGARYAFEPQVQKGDRETEDRKVGAINAANFALARKRSKLENIRLQSMEPWKADPAAFLNMPPLLDLEKDDIKVDVDALGFLFETEYVNLVGEITIAVAKYRSLIDSINQRSILHREQVQPALERAGIMARTHYTFEDIESALGQRLYVTLRQATDQSLEGLPAALAYLEAVSAALTAAGKKLYPHRRIMKVDSVPPDGKI